MITKLTSAGSHPLQIGYMILVPFLRSVELIRPVILHRFIEVQGGPVSAHDCSFFFFLPFVKLPWVHHKTEFMATGNMKIRCHLHPGRALPPSKQASTRQDYCTAYSVELYQERRNIFDHLYDVTCSTTTF